MEEDIISIFIKGVKNSEFFNKRKEGISFPRNCLKISRLLWFRLITRRKTLLSSKVIFIWEHLHEKVLRSYEGERVVLLAQKNQLGGDSFIAYLPFFILVKSLWGIPTEVKKSHLSYEWFFYKAIVNFIFLNDIKCITIAGHYDLRSTWISYLAKKKHIEMVVSQHGANSMYKLPYKIPVDRVDVFSQAEEEMFRITVLNPEETVFLIKGFQTSLVFSEGGFTTKTIAIASQPGYEERVLRLAEDIILIDDNINIIIYSHPKDQFNKGLISINKGRHCRVEKKERYWDVDYLIVFTSTLAYDYWACEKFSGQIFCYFDESCSVALYNDKRAILIYPETCYNQLKEYLNRSHDI